MTWGEIAARAPRMAATMASYLDQLEVSSRPNTVSAVDLALRLFAHRVTTADPTCVSVAAIGRPHIEDFKTWQAARPGRGGKPLSTTTIRHRLGFLRTFFERIIEWDYDDAPARLPIHSSDFPALDEALPKFLDDPTAAKFMAALAQDPNRRRRLMVELLARTGMRVGELAALEDDAMVRLGDLHQLRIPVGKLHNDRYVPLLPMLFDLIVDYKAWRGPVPFRILGRARRREAIRPAHHPALRRRRGQAGRDRSRPSPPVAPHPGHPVHQPGHEPRGDRCTARPPVDGHDAHLRSHLGSHRGRRVLQGDRGGRGQLPTDGSASTVRRCSSTDTTKPPTDHRRLLANGHCTRPALLDCVFESVCERCGFFETGPQFVTILKRQRKHADQRGQSDRRQLFDGLIEGVAEAQ